MPVLHPHEEGRTGIAERLMRLVLPARLALLLELLLGRRGHLAAVAAVDVAGVGQRHARVGLLAGVAGVAGLTTGAALALTNVVVRGLAVHDRNHLRLRQSCSFESAHAIVSCCVFRMSHCCDN